MAEAKTKHKLIDVGKFAASEADGEQYADLKNYATLGETVSACFDGAEDTPFSTIAHANNAAWNAVEANMQYWFFKLCFTQLTGISTFFVPQDAIANKSYAVSFCDNQLYRVNMKCYNAKKETDPNGVPTAYQGSSFLGFAPHWWTMVKTKTNEDLTETQEINTIKDPEFLKILGDFDGKDANKKLPKKFDFCFNEGYMRKGQVLTSTDGDLMFGAANNDECIYFVKGAYGILVFNWADASYKGDRRNVGSYNSVSAKLHTYVTRLVENGNIKFLFDKDDQKEMLS